ncbi:MAG: ABC transporter ATP-binding protein [Lachnospiraceae bacterium]|nr:ABC transporter ATP-binding protein [Lachnospiraceae bacterium]
MSAEPLIRIKNVTKIFDLTDDVCEVFDGFNIDIHKNQFVCILGHSGCGKSTLLRIIAGFEEVNEGAVIIDNKVHDKPGKDVIMLFQSFEQLLPWKTVIKNVAYPIFAVGKVKSKKEAVECASDILDEVGLSDFKDCYPHQLSGGMKQRAAVARALALKPSILLMDEPFASLDEKNRREMQELTKNICSKYNMTIIFVTHSIEEAITLADRIIVIGSDSGNIKCDIENRYNINKDIETKKEMISVLTNIMI